MAACRGVARLVGVRSVTVSRVCLGKARQSRQGKFGYGRFRCVAVRWGMAVEVRNGRQVWPVRFVG